MASSYSHRVEKAETASSILLCVVSRRTHQGNTIQNLRGGAGSQDQTTALTAFLLLVPLLVLFPPSHYQMPGGPSPVATSSWLHFPVSKASGEKGSPPHPPFPQALPNFLRVASLQPPGLPLPARAPPQSSHTSPASTASTRQHVAPVASWALAKVLGQM